MKKRILSLLLVAIMVLSSLSMAFAAESNVKITIIGTTDLHANILNYSYEDNKEVDNVGMSKVYSIIKEIRKENPNTILIDNGDTIQGTILSDDLFNFELERPNPVIDIMNMMGYDSMTLGNHEFNFGLEMVEKLQKEANFPILAANASWKKDGKLLAKDYVIKEVAGVKVGILGYTNPNIPKWDGPKVTELEFKKPADIVKANIEAMKKEGADIIVVAAHMGDDSEYGNGDSGDEIIEVAPEIVAILTGHAHKTVNKKIGNTLVGAAKNAGAEVVRFDLELAKVGNTWKVVNGSTKIIDIKTYESAKEVVDASKIYHDETLEFLKNVIGKAKPGFLPAAEINGIPQAQLQDTALIDLINEVQLKYTGADVSGAALFQTNSNLKEGDITFSNIFNIYKYPNTLVGVEVTGAELKAYMEWSANYFNTFAHGDINISFNPNIRVYNFDMFQGVDYKIDVSKPAGQRIVDVKFKGEPLKDDQKLKLAINNYRYGGLKSAEIIIGEPYFDSDPKALRSYIADYIKENSPLEPIVNNNWEIIGANLNHPLRAYLVDEINAGRLELPKSEDGRTVNVKALNADDMIKQGLIPDDVLAKYGIEVIKPETKPEKTEEVVYIVISGDVLWKIAQKYGTTWEKLAEYNKLANPHLIFVNQQIKIPAK